MGQKKSSNKKSGKNLLSFLLGATFVGALAFAVLVIYRSINMWMDVAPMPAPQIISLQQEAEPKSLKPIHKKSKGISIVAEKASPPPVDKNMVADLIAAVNRDDVCGLMQIIDSSNAYNILEAFSAVPARYNVLGFSAAAEDEIFSETSPLMGFVEPRAQTEVGQLYQTLAFLGLHALRPKLKEGRLDRANNLLSDLRRKHPNNSYYAWLDVILRQKKGESSSAVRDSVLGALAGAVPSHMMKKVHEAIFSKGLTNATALLVASWVDQWVADPPMRPIFETLQNDFSRDEDISRLVMPFAWEFVTDNRWQESTVFGFERSQYLYQFGRNLYQEAFKWRFPDYTPPNLPEWPEITRGQSTWRKDVMQTEINDLRGKICDRSFLDSMYSGFKKSYERRVD